jgi:hypothetical protein
MSGKPGRSGRKPFSPTPEQRNAVKIMAAIGMPHDQIRMAILNPTTMNPVDADTLAKHFKRELEAGMAEIHALLGSFMVATILGQAPPEDTKAITNEKARTSLLMFFAKTRMGWKETRAPEHADKDGGPIGRSFVFKRI